MIAVLESTGMKRSRIMRASPLRLGIGCDSRNLSPPALCYCAKFGIHCNEWFCMYLYLSCV